jgi:hypothetical protein
MLGPAQGHASVWGDLPEWRTVEDYLMQLPGAVEEAQLPDGPTARLRLALNPKQFLPLRYQR